MRLFCCQLDCGLVWGQTLLLFSSTRKVREMDEGDFGIDHHEYLRFTGKQRLETATNSLYGIIGGLVADRRVNKVELDALNSWLASYQEFLDRHPFNELIPHIHAVVADGVIEEEERSDCSGSVKGSAAPVAFTTMSLLTFNSCTDSSAASWQTAASTRKQPLRSPSSISSLEQQMMCNGRGGRAHPLIPAGGEGGVRLRRRQLSALKSKTTLERILTLTMVWCGPQIQSHCRHLIGVRHRLKNTLRLSN
jgi:hypothetical protein